MTVVYVVVTVVAAAVNAYGATVDFTRAEWVVDNMGRLGIPEPRLLPLGALKAAGALGLLVGIVVPPIGVAAAAGLVLYFAGAVVVVLGARWYGHLPYPAAFGLLAVAALALRLASL